MAFWQSPVWTTATDSIYEMQGRTADPHPMSPWREAFALWRRAPAYDAVVTMGSRESFAYGLLCLLTGRPSRQILTEYFIDDARPSSPLWHLKTWLHRRVVRRCLGVLTNSSAEVLTIAERFDLSPERLRYVPMHSNTPAATASAHDEGYVFSGGRTLRDYPTLLAAAAAWPCRVVVVCGSEDLRGQALPPNLDVYREVPREQYLDLMDRCRVVALPLLPTVRSTGQVVMLEAMAMGKPVVTTCAPGTVDHVREGETGVLVEPRDVDALARAVLALWQDPARAHHMGLLSREEVLRHADFDTHARAKLAAIEELWRSAASAPWP